MSVNQAQEQEIFEALVDVNRCVKVVKGGRKQSFSATSIAGDKRGMVGIGFAKAIEVVDAREKASRKSKKQMFRVPLRDSRTLHYDITVKVGATKVVLRAAPPGTGVIAGGPVRTILEFLGVKDVVAKIIGSNNPHNVLRAVKKALLSFATPKLIAEMRGQKVSDLTSKRVKFKKASVNASAESDSDNSGKDEAKVNDKTKEKKTSKPSKAKSTPAKNSAIKEKKADSKVNEKAESKAEKVEPKVENKE